MALKPLNAIHKEQILAGIKGRNKGHKFEKILTDAINAIDFSNFIPLTITNHINTGNPAHILISYIIQHYSNLEIINVKAFWLGGLATGNEGDQFNDSTGKPIKKSKSDILLQLETTTGTYIKGISIKTCNKSTPTNAQMFFTTATAFCNLLRNNNINVSNDAQIGLQMFCGDIGFRPLDRLDSKLLNLRISDLNRFYWEELPHKSIEDLENLFTTYQDEISKLLFQKAYKDEAFTPEFLLHQTVKYDNFDMCKVALFSIQEIVCLSRAHQGFHCSPYTINKGTYKHDNSIHLAPRFGFIQFQRGGQKQHPTQLQFNLKAGYFNLIND